MPNGNNRLSGRTVAVLEMIAAGNSYEQILSAHPTLTYLDIFDAAREALDLSVSDPAQPTPTYRVADVRSEHGRAYERWTPTEDTELTQLIRGGLTVAQVAERLKRQPSAIHSRINKLGLISE